MSDDLMNNPVIEAEGLEIIFSGTDWPILSKVNFVVPERSITIVAGPSGSGKSTLMNVAIGMLRPAAGTMRVFDEVVHDISDEKLSELRQRMGVLYQSGALFQNMTLIENVMFPLVERSQCTKPEARRRAKKVLAEVQISSDAYDLTPDRLSGGQKKRGGLARALVTNPDLLLCDEPSSGLDPVTGMKIDKLFLDLHKKNPDQTVVILSHDLHSIRKIADYIVFVHDHREHPAYKSVRVHGPAEEVLNDPDPVVQEFFRRQEQSSG